MEYENPIHRRFELIDKDKKEALLSLVEQKGLSADDLMLILGTIKKCSPSADPEEELKTVLKAQLKRLEAASETCVNKNALRAPIELLPGLTDTMIKVLDRLLMS